jgi:hypothetical protein
VHIIPNCCLGKHSDAERMKIVRTPHHEEFYENEIFLAFCSDCDVTEDTQLQRIQLVF